MDGGKSAYILWLTKLKVTDRKVYEEEDGKYGKCGKLRNSEIASESER